MPYIHNVFHRLGLQSEENQLLAEETWIVDALSKIRNQRNSLQIERLQMESLKTYIRKRSIHPLSKMINEAISETSIPSENDTQEDSMASALSMDGSVVNLMQNVTAKEIEQNKVDKLGFDDEVNEEELNLAVNNPVYDMNLNQDINMEEDDDDEHNDDMYIDMNMLMNCKHK